MKDWETRLRDLNARLMEWRESYDREFQRLRRERGRGLFKRLDPERVLEIAAEAQRAAGEDVLAEVTAFLDELCDFYEGALPGVRPKIRAQVGFRYEVHAFLWQYAEEAPEGIATADDAGRLRRALLAVSIDDHRVETGQMLDLLGRLWVSASRAGIDPDPLFQKVAEISNPGTSGGAGRTQSHLAGFGSSKYFRDAVAPLLDGRRAG